jgi:hypothetical protein
MARMGGSKECRSGQMCRFARRVHAVDNVGGDPWRPQNATEVIPNSPHGHGFVIESHSVFIFYNRDYLLIGQP